MDGCKLSSGFLTTYAGAATTETSPAPDHDPLTCLASYTSVVRFIGISNLRNRATPMSASEAHWYSMYVALFHHLCRLALLSFATSYAKDPIGATNGNATPFGPCVTDDAHSVSCLASDTSGGRFRRVWHLGRCTTLGGARDAGRKFTQMAGNRPPSLVSLITLNRQQIALLPPNTPWGCLVGMSNLSWPACARGRRL